MPKSRVRSWRARAAAALGTIALAAAALTACAASDSRVPTTPTTDAATAPAETDRPLVLTTFTVLADIAQNVAGERLEVVSITKPGAEIHGYEPTPGDVREAARADLILDNGLGLEAWFAQFVESADAPHVVVSEGIETLPIEGDDDLVNPHAWMSPIAAQLYVDNIVAAFSDLDPAHADEYAANGEAYKAQLQEVHDELVVGIGEVPPWARALVTCEGAFSYLARDIGLTEAYIWPVNAEQQATPRRIAETIEFVEATSVPAVFCESTVSDKAMLQVVESTDAAFGGILYVDSLSEPDGPVPTYLDLLRHDAETIVAGLTGGAR